MIEFDGWDDETLIEAVELVRIFNSEGLDFLNVSMGFSSIGAAVPWAKGFMRPIAARVRVETDLPVGTAWGMDNVEDATASVDEERLDLVVVGRAHLADPHYAARLARNSGIADWHTLLPVQYAHWLGSRYAQASE